MRRSRNGEISEMIALRAISASTTNSRLRYGLKRRAMRRGLLIRYLIVVSMIEVLNYLVHTAQRRGEKGPRLRRVQPAIPGTPRWARAAADRRAADQAGELQAAEAVGARDMERTRHLERRPLEDRRGQVADLDGGAQLVRVERHRRIARQLLVARRAVAAVDQRRAHHQRVRARGQDALLGPRLPAPVVGDRVGRVVLAQRAPERP